MGIISDILPGVAAMANIHPLFVHFPIALLNSFLLLEALGILLKREDMRVAATWTLYLGTAGALAAVSAGLWAASTVPHTEEVHPIMLRHRNFGAAVLVMALFLSVWRLKGGPPSAPMKKAMHIFIAFITAAVMTFGADLGGLMVYKYGVAVKAAPQPDKRGHDMQHEH